MVLEGGFLLNRPLIVDIVAAIQSNMDKRLFTRGIFIDLKKAFDTVNHHILPKKFEYFVE